MKRLVIIISIILLIISLFLSISIIKMKKDFSKYSEFPIVHSFEETGIDYITDKKTAINVSKLVWEKELGYSSRVLMFYHTRLVEDNFWVIEGVSLWNYIFGTCGGGPYIIISKNGKVLFVGETG